MRLFLPSLLFPVKKEYRPEKSGELYMTLFLWGLGVLLILLIGLLAIDGYLFYFVRTYADMTEDVQNPSLLLSPREVDHVIDLLDRREQEFNTLLESL